MALVEWTDEFSVNIREIDAQHKQLIAMINDLHEVMRTGGGKDALAKILDDLADYTTYHFAYEESLLVRHGYHDAADHAAEHEQLAAQVAEMQQHFHAGTFVMSVDVMQFLKQLLAFHMQGTDRQYTAFLNGKGVV
jgi:hemerythrin